MGLIIHDMAIITRVYRNVCLHYCGFKGQFHPKKSSSTHPPTSLQLVTYSTEGCLDSFVGSDQLCMCLLCKMAATKAKHYSRALVMFFSSRRATQLSTTHLSLKAHLSITAVIEQLTWHVVYKSQFCTKHPCLLCWPLFFCSPCHLGGSGRTISTLKFQSAGDPNLYFWLPHWIKLECTSCFLRIPLLFFFLIRTVCDAIQTEPPRPS